MKKCKQGYYYCYDDKKCKKIPSGYRVGLGGWLRKEKEEEKSEDNGDTESKKNGNGNGGNGNGDSGAVSEGWSEKYKKSIDCKNPKGFSQRAHCQGRKKVNEQNNDIFHQGNSNPQMRNMPMGQRNVDKLANAYARSVRSGLIDGANQMSQVKKPKLMKSDSVRVAEAKEKGDHEVSMAQSQLKKSEENIRKLRKALGTKEKNIPAWVQAKITDTEHNTDAASSYMDEGKRDGKSAKDKDYSLHDWFKGGGWVQAGGKYDGKPCAKQPGQKTKPFCRDADDRASMSKDEREKRAKKKRKEDPNPNRKGKAKMVTAEEYDSRNPIDKGNPDKSLERAVRNLGDDPKKVLPSKLKLADSYSDWRGEIELDENALLKLGLGAAATVAAGMGLGKMADNFVKDQRKRKPSDYAVKTGLGAYAAKARNAGQLGEQTKPLDKKYKKQKPGIKNIPIPELDSNPLSNDPIIRRAPKGTASYSDVYYDEQVVSEEGKKDACYKKVKARYDVWPSAYASGALVKCRKVGAANWGNSSKKENFSDWKSDMLLSEAGFKDMGPEDFKRYLSSLNSDEARDIAKKAYAKKNPAASRSVNPSMDVSKPRTTSPTGGPQMPNVNRDAKWNRGQNFRDPRAQQVYDHMTRTRVDAAAETAAAQASKNAAQARRAARSGGGLFSGLKPLVKPTLNLIRKNKYGALAAGGAMAAAYGLGKLQNSFSRAPKNESYDCSNWRDEYIEENIIRSAKMATKVIKALGKSKVRKSLPPRNLRNLSPERKQEIMYQAQKRIKSYKPGEIDKPASRKYAADRLNTVYSRRQNVIKQGGSPKEAAAQSISSMGPGDALGKDFNIKRGGRGRRGAHGPQTDRGKGNKAARRSGQEVADTGDIDVHYRPTRSQSIQRSRDRRSMRSMERRLNNLLNLNNSYEFSNWRDDFIPTDYETVDLITADPIQVPDSNIQKINERVEYKEGDYVDHPSTREAMKRANKTSLEKLNDRTQEIRNSIKLQAPRNPLTLPSFTTEAKKCWKGYKKAGTQKLFGKTYNRCVKEGYSNWREELAESGYDSTFGRGEMGEPQGTQYPKVNKDKFNKDMEFWRRHLKTAPPVRQASAKKTIQVAHFEPEGEIIEGAAWTRKEGQNKKGGLNEKGRKSYERENPGSDLKAPSKEKGNKRRKSFCARMKGMKKKLTSKKTANDPDSRINKSLRAWNC